MKPEADVVIVGGGVAGASMAAVMAGQGWRTILLDRHTFPRHKACGEFLSPEAAGLWQSLGLDLKIAELHPTPIKSIRLTAFDGTALELPISAPAFGISRYLLDRSLQDEARTRGAEIRSGVSVTGIRFTESGGEVQLRRREERIAVQARCVIGAWGRSAPPGKATSHRIHDPSGERALNVGIKLHVEGMERHPRVELYFFDGGYLGLSPVEDGRYNVAALVSHSMFERSGGSAFRVLQAACRMNSSLAERIAGHIPVSGTQAAAFPVHVSGKTTAWGDIPHVGDAARSIPPLCGDGMAMALQSVRLCAGLADRYLRSQLTLSEWRIAYERSMRKHGAGQAFWGRLLQAVLCRPILSPLALRLGGGVPGLAARLFRATRVEG